MSLVSKQTITNSINAIEDLAKHLNHMASWHDNNILRHFIDKTNKEILTLYLFLCDLEAHILRERYIPPLTKLEDNINGSWRQRT